MEESLRAMLECSVCFDIFDDPWVCRDGFVYCRECIGRWVADKESWRSPRNNVEYPSSDALVVRDFQRGDLAKSLKSHEAEECFQEFLGAHEDQERERLLRKMASLRYRGELLVQKSKARIAVGAVVHSALGQRQLIYDALELALHSDSLGRLGTNPRVVEAVIANDVHKYPFISLTSVLIPLLESGGLFMPIGLRRIFWRHCQARAQLRRDAIHVRPEVLARRGITLGFQGLFARLADEPDGVAVFKCHATGATLRCPQRPMACSLEEYRSTLQLGDLCEVLSSRHALYEESALDYWRARDLGPQPPFPDASPEMSGVGSLVEKDECMGVFEVRIKHLPRHFHYLYQEPDEELQRRLSELHERLHLKRRRSKQAHAR